MLSVMPSDRYSAFGFPLSLLKGKTAMESMGGRGERRIYRPIPPSAIIATASPAHTTRRPDGAPLLAQRAERPNPDHVSDSSDQSPGHASTDNAGLNPSPGTCGLSAPTPRARRS